MVYVHLKMELWWEIPGVFHDSLVFRMNTSSVCVCVFACVCASEDYEAALHRLFT